MGWRNVWFLTAAQALSMCGAPMIVFVGGIIGTQLAPTPTLSTLPVAFFVVGTAICTVPVALLMQKFTRKIVFIGAAMVGIFASYLISTCLAAESFWGYCLGVSLLGVNMAAVQQYRFAAMESVASNEMATAASRILLGGIVAAILGPELAVWGKSWTEHLYEGAFYILALVYLGAIGFLCFYQEGNQVVDQEKRQPRPMLEIMRQPVFWVAVLSAAIGFAVMSFIMTATPVSMHVMDGHDLDSSKWVIQSHMLAMYLPSLFTAQLLQYLKTVKLILLGLAFYSGCILMGIIDSSLLHYWAALVLLGIGWNFLYTSGTTLLPSSYQEGDRFRVQAFNDFFIFASQAIAALGSGWLLHQLGWNWLLTLTLPFIAVLLLLVTYWRMSELRQVGQT